MPFHTGAQKPFSVCSRHGADASTISAGKFRVKTILFLPLCKEHLRKDQQKRSARTISTVLVNTLYNLCYILVSAFLV